uniref:Zinc finger protein 283 n=1 Tax=Moschus moschiferus TaxID=68415 RepID=A0A8C6DS78_MOSMO
MLRSCSGFSGLSPIEEPYGALISSLDSRTMTDIWSRHTRRKIHFQKRTFLK